MERIPWLHMPDFERPSGLRLTLPETFVVNDISLPSSERADVKHQRATSASAESYPPDFLIASLLDGVLQEDLQLFDKIEFQPTVEATSTSGKRAHSATILPEMQTATLEVPLREDEEAIVLIEQDGMYVWHVNGVTGVSKPGGNGKDNVSPNLLETRSEVARTSIFNIDVYASKPVRPNTARSSLLQELIYAPLRAYVLKFIARLITGQLVDLLEHNSRQGLVTIQGLEPAAWNSATASASRPAVPRETRVLLFIHGTFSSTAGGFGALCSTTPGRRLLSAVQENYDVVIGFDHSTLKSDPLANARDLLTALEKFFGPDNLFIDVITHSRGGLVLRCLTEMLLPSSGFKPHLGHLIMVGCPNAGTLLAEPQNWKTLIDVYTNLAVAACRLLSFDPQAIGVAFVLQEVVRDLGGLLKYMAVDASGQNGVPGLDAMRPSGSFIHTLNENQPGLRGLNLYAITSDFVPQISGEDVEPREMPLRFAATLAAAVTNELMKEENDLVVNTSSMTELDAEKANLLTECYAFGKSNHAYHTCYFARPETVATLARWLGLSLPQAIVD